MRNEIDVEIVSLKRDVRCLKYEMKKQKSISRRVSREVGRIEQRGIEFAQSIDCEEIRCEA
jgi:hypothetical protein